MRKYIDLSNAVLIGTGDHKKVFIDPTDTHKCIKVLFRTPDEDLERELKYRKIREKRGLKSKLLTTYFGMVETNFGTGYVFEHVIDFDGSTSRTLAQLLKNAVVDTRLVPVVTKVMCNFKAMWFEELISVSNVEPGNFMVQRYSETDFTVRIIDNIGSSAFIPLPYYFDCVAKFRTKKYWNRFLNELQRDYPSVMTAELNEKLVI